jgi:hypothetical protein
MKKQSLDDLSDEVLSELSARDFYDSLWTLKGGHLHIGPVGEAMDFLVKHVHKMGKKRVYWVDESFWENKKTT